MTTKTKLILCTALLISSQVFAQNSIKEIVDKTGRDKIKKNLMKQFTGMFCFDDGHGMNPYLTSNDQIPDTIALITFYVFDPGVSTVSSSKTTHGATGITTTSTSVYSYKLSEAGGNYFANQLHKESIDKLKATFKAHGIVLLTPDEFLNTPEKRDFYYNQFQPQVSKLGSFLSGLEQKRSGVAVCADYYRGFDTGAATDYKRSISLGDELTKKLGVDAVMSVSATVVYDGKTVSFAHISSTINGPNPVPRQDKKYIGSNGAGYQEGLVYFSAYYNNFKPVKIAGFKKSDLNYENYEGFGELLSVFAEASVETMNNVVAKKSKK